MSYVEMRQALEAVQGDMEEIGHIKSSTGKQVDDALKSEITTAELVSELRKRGGVEAYDVPTKGTSRIITFENEDTGRSIIDVMDGGSAIILRIMVGMRTVRIL